MTTGQFVFCSGIGLLILTIILACIFWLNKPQYIPGDAACDKDGGSKTQKLRSNYPTDRLTARKREKQAVNSRVAGLQKVTEDLNADCCRPDYDIKAFPDDGKKEARRTEKLVSNTSRRSAEVSPLSTATTAAIPSEEKLLETVLLAEPQTEPPETLLLKAADSLIGQDDGGDIRE